MDVIIGYRAPNISGGEEAAEDSVVEGPTSSTLVTSPPLLPRPPRIVQDGVTFPPTIARLHDDLLAFTRWRPLEMSRAPLS